MTWGKKTNGNITNRKTRTKQTTTGNEGVGSKQQYGWQTNIKRREKKKEKRHTVDKKTKNNKSIKVKLNKK